MLHAPLVAHFCGSLNWYVVLSVQRYQNTKNEIGFGIFVCFLWELYVYTCGDFSSIYIYHKLIY